MRLIDTVMPSASMLDEVKLRKALEVGAELKLEDELEINSGKNNRNKFDP